MLVVAAVNILTPDTTIPTLINLVLIIMPSINHNNPNLYRNYQNNLIIRVITAIYLITLVITIRVVTNLLSIIILSNNHTNSIKSRNHHSGTNSPRNHRYLPHNLNYDHNKSFKYMLIITPSNNHNNVINAVIATLVKTR